MLIILYLALGVCVFTFVETILLRKEKTTPAELARQKLSELQKNARIQRFLYEKQLEIKRMGADEFLSDGITVGRWYLYKALAAAVFGFLGFFFGQILTGGRVHPAVPVLMGILGWFFFDLMLRTFNKGSNDDMMPDIMEMSRSVLYGKRGGQYIGDALKDSVMVVENKRLKTALIRMKNDLDAGKSIDEALDEFQSGFHNGEISAFCTVIKSLQSTGQVDEALKTLERSIEREQISVNKRRLTILENKTMMYVLLIAFDILAVILYCIIMKLLEMQIAF